MEVEFCLPYIIILIPGVGGGGGGVLPIMVCGEAPPKRGTAFSGFRYNVCERDFTC